MLVDTKYEFGRAPDGALMLIDEVHAPGKAIEAMVSRPHLPVT